MKTFKIVNGDLVFDSVKNLAMVEGKEEEIQSLERTLSTNTGEWFLNTLHGLDYSEIQGKGKSEEGIRLAITEAAFQEERIIDIEFLEVKINPATRSLIVNFKFETLEGNIIEGEEVLAFG